MMMQVFSYVFFVMIETVVINTIVWAFLAFCLALLSFVFWELPSIDAGTLLSLFRALLAGSFLTSVIYSFFPAAQKVWRV